MVKDLPSNTHEHGELRRGLNNRQLQLIAIGGTIGTSLFLGASKTISLAGPSIIIDYFLSGVVVFFAMRILGEMLLSNTHFRSFRDIATHYLGHWAGFIVGWMYWAFWIVTGMQDSIAVSVYLEDYFPHLPTWFPGLAVVLIIFILNSVAVNVFGELEFWLSLIKIVAIVLLIVVGFYMIFSDHHWTFKVIDSTGAITEMPMQSSVSNLWTRGFFGGGSIGLFLGFQIAFLAYSGVEAIGTTAAEVIDPKKTLPKAINAIPIRISIFYVGAIFVILCAVPWDTIKQLHGSPFVNIFSAIGIPSAGLIMTFVLITAAVSGANSGLYSTSRMMFGLAVDGQAPASFGKTSKSNVPLRALSFGFLVIAVPVVLVSVFTDDPMNAFTIFASWSTGCVLCVWIIVIIAYFAYIKNHASLHDNSTYKVPATRITAACVLAFFCFVVVIMCFDDIPRWGLILSGTTLCLLLILYYAFIQKIEHVEDE